MRLNYQIILTLDQPTIGAVGRFWTGHTIDHCERKEDFYSKRVLVSSLFQDGTPTSKTFEHVTSEIGAEEAEEVGVEHLLRYTSFFNWTTQTPNISWIFNYFYSFMLNTTPNRLALMSTKLDIFYPIFFRLQRHQGHNSWYSVTAYH